MAFIYQNLNIIGFPFPDIIQYVVKLNEISIGLALIYIALRG